MTVQSAELGPLSTIADIGRTDFCAMHRQVSRPLPTWFRVLLSTTGGLLAGLLVLGACWIAGLPNGSPVISSTVFLMVALVVVSDWAIFERLFLNGVIVAHGEEPPQYRDYVGVRLVVLVAGMLVGIAANNWKPPNMPLVWAGFAVGLGAQLYALIDGLRDIIKPRNRRL